MLIGVVFLFDALMWRRLFAPAETPPDSAAEPEADSGVDLEATANEPAWMTVFVRASGRAGLMTLAVASTTTAWELKQFLAKRLDAQPEALNLTFGGRPLRDTVALAEFSVVNASTLDCSFVGDGLLGGGKGQKRKVLARCVFQLGRGCRVYLTNGTSVACTVGRRS